MKTIEIDGHVFSYWETPLNAPYIRVLAYFQAQQSASLGIGEQDLKACFRLIRDALNAGQFSKIGAIIETMEAQANLYASWRNIFQLGNTFILIDDEPIKEMSEKHTKIKSDLCEQNEKIRAFFLSETWRSLTNLKLSSIHTPPSDYLNQAETRTVESLFLKLVNLPIYKNT